MSEIPFSEGDIPLMDIPLPGVEAPAVIIPEPAPAIDPSLDREKAVARINDEVRIWENGVSRQLDDFNAFASAWRLDLPARSRDLSTFSNTRTAETTRAVEALSTMMYRMMTSYDPNFSLYPLRDDVTDDHLFRVESVLRTQQRRLNYRRKLLRATRTMCLFGTVPVETPWFMETSNGNVYFEGTDFQPLSLLQFAFDPAVSDIKTSDFHTILSFVSANRLRYLASSSPDVWDGEEIERAIEESKDTSKISHRVRDRLQRAGYTLEDGKTLLVSTRWGVDDDGREQCWTSVNEKFLVRAHENTFGHGKRPILVASMIDFELEPYGYGVGNLGKRIQSELDANRNRNNDMMTFSQFNMWKTTRTSGLRTTGLKIRPMRVVELDDINSLEPLRPALEALRPGLEHEDRLREDFRSVVGATANLQAAVTEATATEASLTQNEAVRRISVLAEVVSEELVREYLYQSIKNNAEFLDYPLWVNMTGDGPPSIVRPDDLRKEIGVDARVTTDKDFRPERVRRMIEALQILTSMRQQMPANIDITPLVKEISRSFGINPKDVIRKKTVLDKMKEAIMASQALQAKAPDMGSATMTEGGAGGNTAAITTPMGDVAGSPNPEVAQ